MSAGNVVDDPAPGALQADLAAIANDFDKKAGEGAPAPESGGGGPAAPAAGGSEAAREFLFCFEMVRAFPLTKKRFPKFHAAMTDPEMKESAEALGALFDKYGWSMSGWIERYKVEFNAAVVFGGWSYALAGALRSDLEARAAAAPAAPDGNGG